jgi:hypothetical protein
VTDVHSLDARKQNNTSTDTVSSCAVIIQPSVFHKQQILLNQLRGHGTSSIQYFLCTLIGCCLTREFPFGDGVACLGRVCAREIDIVVFHSTVEY